VYECEYLGKVLSALQKLKRELKAVIFVVFSVCININAGGLFLVVGRCLLGFHVIWTIFFFFYI